MNGTVLLNTGLLTTGRLAAGSAPAGPEAASAVRSARPGSNTSLTGCAYRSLAVRVPSPSAASIVRSRL